jgi:hypothetical protein
LVRRVRCFGRSGLTGPHGGQDKVLIVTCRVIPKRNIDDVNND